jgi:foldase protein PrsA
MIKLALAALVVLLAAPVASAQAPPLPADAFARVDQTPISRDDFVHWITIASKSDEDKAIPPLDSAEYRKLTDEVVQLLVTFRWIEGEAAARGINVSDTTVKRSFDRMKRESFPRERDYQNFLAQYGETEADILQRVKLDLLSNRIRADVIKGAKTAKGQQRVLDRFVKRFTARWKARTACGEPYKSDDCGTYVPIASS